MHNTLLRNLTLVIFTYNRHEFLKRTIRYWSNYNLKLVILDGSDKKLKDQCLKSKNIKYIYGPKDLYTRLLNSKNYIETEFVILGSDDEFYFPSALISCINFLINNSNFSCCGGIALGFGRTKKRRSLYGQERYPKLHNLTLNHNFAAERVKKHFSNYVPAHFYSVMRTNVWKKICKHVFLKEFSFDAALELQVEFLLLVSGKSKIISELMWMRNLNENLPYRGTSPSLNESFKINHWWNDKIYKNEKKDFFCRMQNACDDLLGIKKNRFNQNQISKLFKIYITKSLYVKKSFFRKILDFIPIAIKNFIKYFLGIYNRDLIAEVRKLETKNILVNYKELKLVLLYLENDISNDLY